MIFGFIILSQHISPRLHTTTYGISWITSPGTPAAALPEDTTLLQPSAVIVDIPVHLIPIFPLLHTRKSRLHAPLDYFTVCCTLQWLDLLSAQLVVALDSSANYHDPPSSQRRGEILKASRSLSFLVCLTLTLID